MLLQSWITMVSPICWIVFFYMISCLFLFYTLDRVKRIWYLSPMRAAKVQARTSAVRSYKQWIKRNLQTESQIPGPSEWLGMRSWNLSWRNVRRHKFVWRGWRCSKSIQLYNYGQLTYLRVYPNPPLRTALIRARVSLKIRVDVPRAVYRSSLASECR